MANLPELPANNNYSPAANNNYSPDNNLDVERNLYLKSILEVLKETFSLHNNYYNKLESEKNLKGFSEQETLQEGASLTPKDSESKEPGWLKKFMGQFSGDDKGSSGILGKLLGLAIGGGLAYLLMNPESIQTVFDTIKSVMDSEVIKGVTNFLTEKFSWVELVGLFSTFMFGKVGLLFTIGSYASKWLAENVGKLLGDSKVLKAIFGDDVGEKIDEWISENENIIGLVGGLGLVFFSPLKRMVGGLFKLMKSLRGAGAAATAAAAAAAAPAPKPAAAPAPKPGAGMNQVQQNVARGRTATDAQLKKAGLIRGADGGLTDAKSGKAIKATEVSQRLDKVGVKPVTATPTPKPVTATPTPNTSSATPTAANQNKPQMGPMEKVMKKFPRFGKVLGFAKKIPVLGPALAALSVISVLSSDRSPKEKVSAVSGALGEIGGGALGFLLGGLLGGFTGPAALIASPLLGVGGAVLGSMFGGTIAEGLAQWMLGQKVTAFPEPSWWNGRVDLNALFNGSSSSDTMTESGGLPETPSSSSGPLGANRTDFGQSDDTGPSETPSSPNVATMNGATQTNLTGMEADGRSRQVSSAGNVTVIAPTTNHVQQDNSTSVSNNNSGGGNFNPILPKNYDDSLFVGAMA